MVSINGISTAECPVSVSSGWVIEVLMLWASSRRFENGLLYGPDLSSWPAHVYDAFDLFNAEENRLTAAKWDADSQQIVPG